MKIQNLAILAATILLASCMPIENKDNTPPPLPSWNESATKSSIISFVNSVTNINSNEFVPKKDRIAVFDNDGTLWNEKPLYIPLEYEIDYIKDLLDSVPELKQNKLYNGIYEGDMSVFHEYTTFELIKQLFASHNGQHEEAYKLLAYEFLTEEKHPKFDRPFKEMTYKPMVELVHYLQANDFNVYIVTGGEITFVRTVSEEIYNIPVENVIGSSVKLKYVSENYNKYLVRTGTINSANDKQVKPTNIELHIGKKPIFAAGNSDGDYEMMEYTLSGDGPSMAILVHHNDSIREYSYMHGTEKAVNDANEKGWQIVSMKDDFKIIFE